MCRWPRRASSSTTCFAASVSSVVKEDRLPKSSSWAALRGVGQQHTGDSDGGKARLKQLQVASKEQNSHGPALPAQLAGVGHLVGVLVQVVDGDVLAGVPQKGLELLHQVGEEQVHSPLDDDGDAGAGLLLEVLGVVVGLEILFLHHGQYLAAGLLTDVRVVVEHAGHGGHTVSGELGNILYGHGIPSFCLT